MRFKLPDLNPVSPFGAINIHNIGLSGHLLSAFNQPMSTTELHPNTSLVINISPCAFPARENI